MSMNSFVGGQQQQKQSFLNDLQGILTNDLSKYQSVLNRLIELNPNDFEDKHHVISIIQSLSKLDGINNQIQSILLQEVQSDQTSLPQPLQEEDHNNMIPMECDQSQTHSITRNEHTSFQSNEIPSSKRQCIQPISISAFSRLLSYLQVNSSNGVTLFSLLSKLSQIPTITGSRIYLDNRKYYDCCMTVDCYFIQVRRIRTGEYGESYHYKLIIADNSDSNGNKKRMAVLTAESLESELVEMNCSGMRENEIIDLNFGGRRWEGGELNGKPFGFGCEYSENGNLVYEGFVFEGKKVCYGKEWNDDGNNNCLVYEGSYWNEERCGKGKSYDLSGNVDFEGEWTNNYGISESGKNDLIVPMLIEEFVIGNTMFNDEDITTLHFSPLLVRLKRIKIGLGCFKHVREFVINGLESLESVKIDFWCFRIDYRKRDDGICRITNCPNLRQLEIGDRSFYDFKSFELSNLNSLQSIEFGYECFFYVDLSLKDLPSLEMIAFGEDSFQKCHVAVFENLLKLHTISFGSHAIAGDNRRPRKTIINDNNSFDNTLIMKNLPSLTLLNSKDDKSVGNFRYMGHVELENIPKLEWNRIRFSKATFLYTADLHSTNARDLELFFRKKSKLFR